MKEGSHKREKTKMLKKKSTKGFNTKDSNSFYVSQDDADF